jgi:Concanavalin A-like lectin/glucanases superfamily/Domain of unknown function (DUF2341)
MIGNRTRLLPGERGRAFATLAQLAIVTLVGSCHRSAASHDAASLGDDASIHQDDVSIGLADAWLGPSHVDAATGLFGGAACDSSTQCVSGACTRGVCSDWSGAMKVVIDTTVQGANISEAVDNFPLLVRLNAANFPFNEARSDGADLRFLGPDGNNLRLEVEYWDQDDEEADIWVLVPHIAGNSADNTIFMYWGDPLAAPLSSGPEVFGNFSCVFHISQDPSIPLVQAANAAGSQNTGTIAGGARSTSRADGIAGLGLTLDGYLSALFTSVQLAGPQTFSVSLWFRTGTRTRGGVAGFAASQATNNVSHDRAISIDDSGRLMFEILHGSVPSTLASVQSYNDGLWHYVTARFGKSGQYLFVDGEAVSDNPSVVGADTYNGYWRFGEEPADNTNDGGLVLGSYLTGMIDEIRVSNEALSDAWIRLSYATQKPDATAVSYLR